MSNDNGAIDSNTARPFFTACATSFVHLVELSSALKPQFPSSVKFGLGARLLEGFWGGTSAADDR
jgi:hypothetical protein